jgi:MoaA/NifB/PqqE/SkfB family radical SAM enzyme
MKKLLHHLIALTLKHTTGFPLWTNLEIDIQSACNRDCEFCPRYNDRSGVRKDANGHQIIQKMPTDQVYRIIDQAHALGFQGKIKLHRLSEGLLDHRYLEFATYIKAKGLTLWEDTNGDVLRKNRELCTQLDGLIDHLTIGLYDYRNEPEKQQEMAFWRSKFKKTELAFSLPPEYCTIRQGSKIYGEVAKNPQALELPCNQPSYFLQIRYDGNVSLCCEDDGCHFDLGNAFTDSLVAIWWSYKHIKIARTLETAGGRHQFPHCSRCYRLQDRISLLSRK